jgi:uncharacterized protein (TIGR04255 family)
MARKRAHLRKAPIVEAVIDLRVPKRHTLTAEAFAGMTQLLAGDYDNGSVVQTLEARFGMDRGRMLDPTAVKSAIGWAYRAKTAVVQFRVDGFTFSRLEPYTTWEEVFGEAFRLWRLYVEKAQPQEVSRAAVRYINRLRVPGPADLNQYLEAPPVLPPPIPQAIRGFLSRVLVEDSTRNASAILVQALEESVDPSTVPLLLDIDAFREEVALPPHDSALPEIFEQLRSLKNDIFYASITERTAEMYE